MITLENKTIELITKELESIPVKYQKPFNSNHEGYGVLMEEVKELENEIFFGEKRSKDVYEHKQRMREEAIQVAAMAIRFIQELT